MVNKRWLLLVILGWMLINMIRIGLPADNGENLIFWMALQQLWLILGSLMALRNTVVLRWQLKDFVRGFTAGLVLFFIINLLNLIIITGLSQVFGSEHVQSWLAQEQAGISMLLGVEDPVRIGLAALLITVGASLSEELLFRGAMLKSLAQVMPGKWAVFCSAIFFALVHFYLIQFIPVLISGIILGRLFTASDNLLRPITAHAVVNTLALLIYIL
ncbi:MAG: lysostaphin resistance A-like protein [Candidatus Wallacebacter cryptica]|jgi:membrane protease YdiL (CAAX protease family)|nr:CPBP family intramembrane metalloprotease [Bacillota bacterium]